MCRAKRTTIEIDEELLARAKRALGATTTRATVEEALRRAADSAESERERRAARQLAYCRDLLLAETALYHGLGVAHVDSDFERIAEVRPLTVRRLG